MDNNDAVIQLLPSACCTIQIISNDKVALGGELKPKKFINTSMPVFLLTVGQFIFMIYFNTYISKDLTKMVLNRPKCKELSSSGNPACQSIAEDISKLSLSFELDVNKNLMDSLENIGDNIIKGMITDTLYKNNRLKLKSLQIIKDMYFGLFICMLSEYVITFHHGYLEHTDPRTQANENYYFRFKSIESISEQYGVGVFNNDILYYFEDRPSIDNLFKLLQSKSNEFSLLNIERE